MAIAKNVPGMGPRFHARNGPQRAPHERVTGSPRWVKDARRAREDATALCTCGGRGRTKKRAYHLSAVWGLLASTRPVSPQGEKELAFAARAALSRSDASVECFSRTLGPCFQESP